MKKFLFFAFSSYLFAGDILNDSLINIGDTKISIMMIIKFLSIFVIGFLAGWFYKYKFINSQRVSDKLSVSTKTLLANIGYYFIIFITIVTSFHAVGINLSSLAVVAGALSVGIGFGLQNIVSNFISGIILMFEKSIEVGHLVELSNGTRGTVRDIKLRATVITTAENADIIVPNSNFIQNEVTNLTLNDEVLKIKIPFSVEYGSNIEQVKELILNIIKSDNSIHIKNDPDREPMVYFMAMGASSLDFELVMWFEGINARRRANTISTYNTLIYNALNANNISIPFPQLDLHLKKG